MRVIALFFLVLVILTVAGAWVPISESFSNQISKVDSVGSATTPLDTGILIFLLAIITLLAFPLLTLLR